MPNRDFKIFLLSLIFAAVVMTAVGCGKSEKNQTTKQNPAEGSVEQPVAELPSLQARLDERAKRFAENASPEVKAAFAKGIEYVRESGVLETALKVGDTIPMFSLAMMPADTLHIAELLRDGPVVLTFYRGGWCPYCSMELKAIRDAVPEFRAAGGRVVAISPEIADSAQSTASKDSLNFYVLSDPGNKVGQEFGIVYRQADEVNNIFMGHNDLSKWNGDDSWELPLPATYVVDKQGIIRYAFVDPDYKHRAEPSEVLKVLKSL